MDFEVKKMRTDCKEKYEVQYFLPPEPTYDWVKKDRITKPPIWCSVDLRDGNQALIEPMSLDEKLQFFQMLVDVGFKEIEVGFPAASETEYNFMRALIERNMIPDDVTVQVLTQAREHIIRRTFEAVKGAPHAIVHVYNSTSVAQREQVFHAGKEEVKKIAVDGAQLLYDLANQTEGNFSFEYSPESFPGTEVDYALEVCNAVLDVWKPTPDHKAYINIPTTVENAMPHVFATQVEYLSKNMAYRDAVNLSLHPHNDRGCGVCDAELGILAGADRIEGTLFGNGERTGNVDIVTLAMNMYTHGVDSGLGVNTNHIAVIGTSDVFRIDRQIRNRPLSAVFPFLTELHALRDRILMRTGKRRKHQIPCIGLPVRHDHPGIGLIALADRRNIVEVQPGIDAVGVHVHGQCHDVDISGTLAIAEKGSLDPVGAGENAQLRVTDAAAAVIMRMK